MLDFFKAIDSNDGVLLKELYQNGNEINETGSTGACVLPNGASQNGKNQPEFLHHTPLTYAILRNKSTDIIKLLIDSGADVRLKNEKNNTDAASNGNTEIVKLLLAAEADVNIKGFNDDTALLRACDKGNSEIAGLLIENGADVTTPRTNSIALPLSGACGKGSSETVKLPIGKGADVNVKNSNEETDPFRK